MAFDESKLADVFDLDATIEEADARATMADLYVLYFETSSVTTASGKAPAGGRDAFETALTGMSEEGAGFQKFQDAVIAFWGLITGQEASVWPGTTPEDATPGTLVPPPGFAGIAAAYETATKANTASSVDQRASAEAIAKALQPLHLGGTVTLNPPPPMAITPIL